MKLHIGYILHMYNILKIAWLSDAEAPKADAPTAEVSKTNDVSNSVEKKEDK